MRYSREALVKLAKFTDEELNLINRRRKKPNRLGFAYQLAFVKLHNRLPTQQPLELVDELVQYVALQLGLKTDFLQAYSERQPTVSEHQNQIRSFLNLSKFGEPNTIHVEQFIFEQACQLEQTHALLSLVRDFLRNHSILEPAESTLRRLV